MNRSKVLDQLRKYKEHHQEEHQFTRIGLFGSYARGTSVKECSDIDIIVELKVPDLFVMGSIKTDLEKIFGTRVDIVRLRKGMNSFLKKRIDREAVYV